MLEKTCTCCGKTLIILEFYTQVRGKFGVRGQCKTCTNRKRAEWYRDNPAKARLRAQTWVRDNKERARETRAAWRRNNPEKQAAITRRRNLKRYGISEIAYFQLLQKQQGRCAICHRPEHSKDHSGRVRRLSVDHDHRTGQVRRLLCAACNSHLGWYERYQKDILAYFTPEDQ